MSNEEKASKERRILIVDDLEPNRLVLGEIIKNMNCIPILAESGKEALELVGYEGYSCYIYICV